MAFSIFFQDHSIVTPPSPTIHNQEQQQQQQQQQQYVGSGQNSIGSRTAYVCINSISNSASSSSSNSATSSSNRYCLHSNNSSHNDHCLFILHEYLL